jgi:hypothetical protein
MGGWMLLGPLPYLEAGGFEVGKASQQRLPLLGQGSETPKRVGIFVGKKVLVDFEVIL